MIDFSPLADVVLCFAEGELDVRRPPTVSTVNGRRRSSTTATPDTPIAGVIGSTWPVSGKQSTRLVEGTVSREDRDVFVTPDSPPLQVADRKAGSQGDIIRVGGDDYELVTAHPWTRGKFGHYLAQYILRNDDV